MKTVSSALEAGLTERKENHQKDLTNVNEKIDKSKSLTHKKNYAIKVTVPPSPKTKSPTTTASKLAPSAIKKSTKPNTQPKIDTKTTSQAKATSRVPQAKDGATTVPKNKTINPTSDSEKEQKKTKS